VNRETSDIGSYTTTYPLPQKVVVGAVKSMTATFYSEASTQGTIVGTASALASLKGCTVQFSQIVFSGTIKTVTAISPNSYFWGSITSSGVTNVNGGFSLELGADVDICYQNGVIALGGYVQMQFVSASTGSVLANSGNDAWYRYVAPSVGTNDIYLLSWSVLNNNSVIIQPYDVTSFTTTSGAISITGFGASPARMIAAGAHRVAFLTSGNGAGDNVVVEGGLP